MASMPPEQMLELRNAIRAELGAELQASYTQSIQQMRSELAAEFEKYKDEHKAKKDHKDFWFYYETFFFRCSSIWRQGGGV